jgi:hypothetical protein
MDNNIENKIYSKVLEEKYPPQDTSPLRVATDLSRVNPEYLPESMTKPFAFTPVLLSQLSQSDTPVEWIWEYSRYMVRLGRNRDG